MPRSPGIRLTPPAGQRNSYATIFARAPGGS